MTSKSTREENVQAVFDLKSGYTLGLADVEILKRVARMALAAMESESGCLPLDYLRGHKDGLEWAAQLAEANHPETGDWLYDDPIELAKAIRKGPDMPPAQPEPVVDVDDNFYSWFGREWAENYQQNQYTTAAKQMLGVMAESAWKAGRRAAMLAAAPQSPGSEPATVPGKWIPVSEQMPDREVDVQVYCPDKKEQMVAYLERNELEGYFRFATWRTGDGIYCQPTHWMQLPAGPQEVNCES